MKLPIILKSNQFYIIILSIVLVIFTFLFISCNTKPKDTNSQIIDSLNHPIYSKYIFDNDEEIINIGIQPLYSPTGIILETVKRDKIFNKVVSDMGLKIKYYSFLKGADVNFYLHSDKLTGGIGGQMPALTAACQNEIMIPVILQRGNVSIISDHIILSDDLKGKRIGYPHGSISQYFILDLIESSGLTENQVTLIPMDVGELPEALKCHEIDLFSAWEPIVSISLKKYPEFSIIYQNITSGYLYFKKDLLKANREFYVQFVAATLRAINWLESNKENLLTACKWNIEEIEKLSNKKFELSASELADCAEKDLFIGIYDLTEKRVEINGKLHNEYKFLKKLGKLPQNSNWESIAKSFDQETVEEIYSKSGEFKIREYLYDVKEW